MTETDDPSDLPASFTVSGTMTASDVTALITLIQGMLAAMEGRITARLDRNAAQGSERWQLHEKEHRSTDERLVELEAKFADHIAKATAFYERYHAGEIAEQARVEPVKGIARWFAANWRTVLLFIVAAMAILGFSGETLNRILGQ